MASGGAWSSLPWRTRGSRILREFTLFSPFFFFEGGVVFWEGEGGGDPVGLEEGG